MKPPVDHTPDALASSSYPVRIKAVRKSVGLNQTDMAMQLGVAPRAYQNYERGDREPPVHLFKALYEKCQVNPVWLLTGQGPMILASSFNIPTSLDNELLIAALAEVAQLESGFAHVPSVTDRARLVTISYEKRLLEAAFRTQP